MKFENAEILALQALGWIAGHEELCPVFLGSTGLDAEEMRGRAGDRVFLASVLEFLTMDDDWVIAFCDQRGLDYKEPLLARHVLSGAGEAPDMGW